MSKSSLILCEQGVDYWFNAIVDQSFEDLVGVRASALHSVGLGFITYFESYQKTLKTGIHNFPVWRSA